jgi:hypothetical protein
MNQIGLGRRAAPDERDRRFMLQRVPTAPVTQRTWYAGKVLDQGATSQCVAYSGVKYLQASPVINRPLFAPADVYRQCLLVDEWPGEDWEAGTSVRALFKVLKTMGYIGEYRWAFDAETVINHVLSAGPVVMGTVWTMDMFMPHNETGFIEPTGSIVGGHAWVVVGASRKRRAVRMINSWGDGWGQRGRAWVSFDSLDYLIRQDGEACVATEILKQ